MYEYWPSSSQHRRDRRARDVVVLERMWIFVGCDVNVNTFAILCTIHKVLHSVSKILLLLSRKFLSNSKMVLSPPRRPVTQNVDCGGSTSKFIPRDLDFKTDTHFEVIDT